MLLPVPIGYFVAIFLMISGLLNCMEFLNSHEEFSSRAELLNGLACNGWGIIASSVILLLIQINKQLENLRFAAVSATTSPIKTTKTKNENSELNEKLSNIPTIAKLRQNQPLPPDSNINRTPPSPTQKTGKSDPGRLNYFKVD